MHEIDVDGSGTVNYTELVAPEPVKRSYYGGGHRYSRFKAIATMVEAIASRFKVIATMVEAIASRFKAIATMVEATASRFKAIAILRWRPSLVGLRPSLYYGGGDR